MLDTSNADFPFTNKRYWTDHDIFNIANIPYDPVDIAQYPQLVPLILQNCRLIVVDANERDISLLNKSKVVNPVDNVSVYGICLLLHGGHLLRSHLAFCVVWEVVILYGMRKSIQR